VEVDFAPFGPFGVLDGFGHLRGGVGSALALQVFEFREVDLVAAAETGFLEREVAEVFAVGEEDLRFDHGGADVGIGLVGKCFGELAAAEGVDAGFERGDAEQSPIGRGEGMDEGFFGVGSGLEVSEEAGDVALEGGAVVGWEEDGAAGETGFDGVVGEVALPVSVVGPVESWAFLRLAVICASDDI
jgi:hypothetical protein